MSELENRLIEMGADNALNMTSEHNAIVRQLEEAKSEAWRIRMPNTAYSVGDKVIIPGVANTDRMLKAVTAGVTANTVFPGDYGALAVGDRVTDGSVVWEVINAIDTSDPTVVQNFITNEFVSNITEEITNENNTVFNTTIQNFVKETPHTHNVADVVGGINYPKYEAAVDLGSVSSYTAPSNGWVYASARRDANYWNLRINGVRVFVTGGSSFDTGSCIVPVRKGEVVKAYASQEDATTEFAVSMVFFPNR